MSAGEDSVRVDPWWMWQEERMVDECRRIRNIHLNTYVFLELKKNQELNRYPRTKAELAPCVDRAERAMRRLLNGENSLTDQTVLGLASVLGLSAEAFCPSAVAWITSMTMSLCGGRVSEDEAKCYAVYRLKMKPSAFARPADKLDEVALADLMRDPASPARDRGRAIAAIEKVVRVLGPVLERIRPVTT